MKHHTLQKRHAFALLLGLTFMIPVTSILADDVPVGRYVSVLAKPELSQAHLLQQNIQVSFPQNVLTLKDAVNFMLQFTGYRLADDNHLSSSAHTLLEQPLPEIDRQLGPMSLKDALLTLSGTEFYLLVDPIDRLISFQIKPGLSQLYTDHHILLAGDSGGGNLS